MPFLSVVMPVYNAEPYIAQAIDSILSQTYQNFEFIIVDDASTDASFEIIQKYARKNKRIKVLQNNKTSGVSITVKKALDICKGDFIARMDADDISYPTRFEKQISYLLSNPKTVAVGGQCLLINKNGRKTGEKKFPVTFEEIYRYIFHFVPLQQPTLMINKTRLPRDFVFYYDGMNTAEEVELIFKLFIYGRVENLADTILKYRIHKGNTSLKNIKKTFLLTLLSRFKGVIFYGYRPTPEGIIVTLTQTIVVLLLPKKMILDLYNFARDFSFNKSKNLFFNFSYKNILSKI